MSVKVKSGSTNVSFGMVMLLSADGTPATGLISTSLTLQYTRNSGEIFLKSTATAGVSIVASTAAHTDWGVGEVDATGSPGLYRVDWPDGAFTAASKTYLVVTGSTIVPATLEVIISDVDDITMGATIADAVWDEAKSGHVGAGSFGEECQSHALSSEVSGLSTAAALATVDANVDAILLDTADMQPKLGTPAADLAADVAAVKAETASILTDTAEIGTAGVGLTNLGGMSATMKAEVRTEADSALDDAMVIRRSTAQAGAAGSITLDAGASGVTDFFKDDWIRIVGGAGAGQVRLCTGYNGTTKVATVAPNWVTNPSATSVFRVLSGARIGDLSAGSVADITSILADTADMQPKLGTPAADVSADIAAIKSETAAIVADTNELQTDDVPGLIAALNDPTAAAIADAVWDEAKSGHVGVGSFGEECQSHALSSEVTGLATAAALTTVDTVVDAIKVKTDGLNFTGADVKATLDGETVVASSVTGNVAGNVTGSVGSVLGSVGSVTGAVGSIGTGGITSSSFGANSIDAAALATDAVTEIRDAIYNGTVDTFNTAAAALTTKASLKEALSVILSVVSGVTSGSGATLKTPDGTSTRVASTLSGGNRTVMSLTPST